MARMSAQQRREQEQAAELAYLEEQRAQWPMRLLNTLERVSNAGGTITVKQGRFHVSVDDRSFDPCWDSSDTLHFQLVLSNPDSEQLSVMSDLAYELMRIEMAKEEAERKAVVLQRALRGGLLKNALYLV